MKIEIILAIFFNGVVSIHWQEFGWVNSEIESQ